MIGDPSTDALGTRADALLHTLQTWAVVHGIPMLVGLLVIGLTVGLLIRFGKRGLAAGDFGGGSRDSDGGGSSDGGGYYSVSQGSDGYEHWDSWDGEGGPS